MIFFLSFFAVSCEGEKSEKISVLKNPCWRLSFGYDLAAGVDRS